MVECLKKQVGIFSRPYPTVWIEISMTGSRCTTAEGREAQLTEGLQQKIIKRWSRVAVSPLNHPLLTCEKLWKTFGSEGELLARPDHLEAWCSITGLKEQNLTIVVTNEQKCGCRHACMADAAEHAKIHFPCA